MSPWKAFPHASPQYRYAPEALVAKWPRLHAGDAEPLPGAAQVRAAWTLFHAGEFEAAQQAGLAIGGAGITVANKAQAIYANHLEESEKIRLEMFDEVARRAEAQIAADPENANAHFWLGYALGRTSQAISIGKALSLGLVGRIKAALETAIHLAPAHADAHAALGACHAEIVDKLGGLIARTQGASKEAGMRLFKEALRLNPGSAIAMIEYANGMVMLEGEKRLEDAERLYAAAAACIPADAAERLDVDLARAELED